MKSRVVVMVKCSSKVSFILLMKQVYTFQAKAQVCENVRLSSSMVDFKSYVIS